MSDEFSEEDYSLFDWALFVGVLVGKHNQPLDQAWQFTFREYVMVVDLENEIKRRRGRQMSVERVDEMVEHLKKLGVKV